jgi:hypothetical protein
VDTPRMFAVMHLYSFLVVAAPFQFLIWADISFEAHFNFQYCYRIGDTFLACIIF